VQHLAILKAITGQAGNRIFLLGELVGRRTLIDAGVAVAKAHAERPTRVVLDRNPLDADAGAAHLGGRGWITIGFACKGKAHFNVLDQAITETELGAARLVVAA